MSTHWLKNLSRKAAQVKLLHPLYNASLGKLEKPLEFLSFPLDLFPGDSGRGRWIANGQIDINGTRIAFDDHNWFLNTQIENTPYFDHCHGFNFLSELQSLGGDIGRKTSRAITAKWLSDFQKYHGTTWSANLSASRLINWLTAYPYAFEAADDDFINDLQVAIYKHYIHLKHLLSQPEKLDIFDRYSALWAIIIMQCHCTNFYDEIELSSHLQILNGALNDLILPDGGIIDRNLSNTIEMAKSLSILRQSLQQSKIQIPPWLIKTHEKLIRTIVYMLHFDKDIPLFQGAVLANLAIVEKIIKQSGFRIRRQDRIFEESGYTVVKKGKATLVIDHGKSSAHLSPLAFELGYGAHRMIVNCGAILNGDQGWMDSLSNFEAHSVLSLPNYYPKSGLLNARASLENLNGAALFIGSHEGYKADCGVMHTRRLYLDQDGMDFRGEDVLVRNIAIKPIEAIIRFHLHPTVKASLTDGSSKILIRLPNGAGFTFFASEGQISLEDSVYCDDGFTIRKTQQICIYCTMSGLNSQIKWAFKKQ